MSREDINLSRRSFLRGNMLTSQGRKKNAQITQPLGPSPPQLGQVSYSACLACATQACVSACEEDIIRIHPENHQLASAPYLDFTRNGCTFCGECGNACPEILDQDPSLSKIIGKLLLDKEKCLAWNGVYCMSCVGRCTEKALRLDKQRLLLINDALCNGCGNCIRPCPVEALSVCQ